MAKKTAPTAADNATATATQERPPHNPMDDVMERVDGLRPGSIFNLDADQYLVVAAPESSEDVVVYCDLSTGLSKYLSELADRPTVPAFALFRDGPKA